MPVKTHEECRKSVCFHCRKKADRPLTQKEIDFIISDIFPAFENHKEYLPGGSCWPCRIKIANKESFAHYNFYELINELSSLRTLRKGGICLCTVCKIAKGKIPSTPRSAPAPLATAVPASLLPIPYICVKCYATVTTSFEDHQTVCNQSQAQKVVNLEQSISPDVQGRFVSSYLKKQETDESGKVLLSTGGSKLPVYIGARKKEKVQVPIQTFLDFQKERPHLSNKDIIK